MNNSLHKNQKLKKLRKARISLTECEQENHFTLKKSSKYGKAIIRTPNFIAVKRDIRQNIPETGYYFL